MSTLTSNENRTVEFVWLCTGFNCSEVYLYDAGRCVECHHELRKHPAWRRTPETREHPAVDLLRQWLLAGSDFDDVTWARQVRDLVEDGTPPSMKAGACPTCTRTGGVRPCADKWHL